MWYHSDDNPTMPSSFWLILLVGILIVTCENSIRLRWEEPPKSSIFDRHWTKSSKIARKGVVFSAAATSVWGTLGQMRSVGGFNRRHFPDDFESLLRKQQWNKGLRPQIRARKRLSLWKLFIADAWYQATDSLKSFFIYRSLPVGGIIPSTKFAVRSRVDKIRTINQTITMHLYDSSTTGG